MVQDLAEVEGTHLDRRECAALAEVEHERQREGGEREAE